MAYYFSGTVGGKQMTLPFAFTVSDINQMNAGESVTLDGISATQTSGSITQNSNGTYTVNDRLCLEGYYNETVVGTLSQN
jgi:hypothetical protein